MQILENGCIAVYWWYPIEDINNCWNIAQNNIVILNKLLDKIISCFRNTFFVKLFTCQSRVNDKSRKLLFQRIFDIFSNNSMDASMRQKAITILISMHPACPTLYPAKEMSKVS